MGSIACYCRVSTLDQSLDRQKNATAEYAQNRLDAELSDLAVYTDKSTGTNTKREEYQEMMAAAEAGEIDAVVVNSISRISRSIRDLDATVDRLKDEGVALHIIDEGISIEPGETEDPYQRAMIQLLGVFAELEARIGQKRTREGIAARMEAEDNYHHGRAPLGFESEDGKLYPTENYDHIGSVLELVRNEELSKRKAADELNTSRKTIDRALDRGELYGL